MIIAVAPGGYIARPQRLFDARLGLKLSEVGWCSTCGEGATTYAVHDIDRAVRRSKVRHAWLGAQRLTHLVFLAQFTQLVDHTLLA